MAQSDRIKQSKGRNLLERLTNFANFENDVLRFIEEEEVPFTNNLGERDIRMTKVHQKISACFQSELGKKCFVESEVTYRPLASTALTQTMP